MSARRMLDGLLIAPAYQIWQIAKYANTCEGRVAKTRNVSHFPAGDRRLHLHLRIYLGHEPASVLASDQ
jgi:hypothetical protein